MKRATNWWLVPPVMPTALPGSGHHEPDIGPLHDQPITREAYELLEYYRKGIGDPMTYLYREVVEPSVSVASPLVEAMHQ